MFIKTCEDVMVPVSQIASVGPEADDPRWGGTYRKIRTVDGSTYAIGAANPHLRELLGTIVKADPGFEVVRYEGGEIRRLPIIAWCIGPQFMPAPITMSMEYPGAEASGEYACADVLCPDGQVRGENGSFATVDQWKAWMDEQADEPPTAASAPMERAR
jgi:hypothetical protein